MEIVLKIFDTICINGLKPFCNFATKSLKQYIQCELIFVKQEM